MPIPFIVISFTVADPFTGLQFDCCVNTMSALSMVTIAGVSVIVNVVVVEQPLFGVTRSVTLTVYVPASRFCAVWPAAPVTFAAASGVVVPFPSNHSIVNCPATGTAPLMLIVSNPFGVAPLQLVLLVVVAADTAGFTWVSVIVKLVIGDLQFVVVFVASTK